jgi:hypothetical protein
LVGANSIIQPPQTNLLYSTTPQARRPAGSQAVGTSYTQSESVSHLTNTALPHADFFFFFFSQDQAAAENERAFQLQISSTEGGKLPFTYVRAS